MTRLRAMITAQVTDQPISVPQLTALIKNPAAGAIASFSGDVRDNDGERKVLSLTYEIHPSAPAVIKEIVTRLAAKHELLGVAVAHRYGLIPIGESAFVVVVSAKHRGPAFAASQEIVEVVKAELPIWKHQVFADGTDEWVNNA